MAAMTRARKTAIRGLRINFQGAPEWRGFVDEIGEGVAVRGVEKGRIGFSKGLLEQTGVNQRTGIAGGIEAFEER